MKIGKNWTNLAWGRLSNIFLACHEIWVVHPCFKVSLCLLAHLMLVRCTSNSVSQGSSLHVMLSHSFWIEVASSTGMSNSNHCAGRTLSFTAIKAYSGPQFGKTCYSGVNFRHIWANFILKWTKISHFYLKIDKNLPKLLKLFIVYSFKSDSVA